MPDIRIQKLRKEFKEVVAVRDVTITFPTSSVTCLLGPSGCGKTTLMRMIAGLEKPTSGDVYFDDRRMTGLDPETRNIGMVFQYPVVYRGLDVYRNIDLPLKEAGLPVEERRKRIEEVSEILDLKGNLQQNIAQLDNSARQKVAVARAVARRPRIILFDEPLTNVDVETKVQLKQALRQLTRQLKQTVVYVTHDQTEAMTLADQIALMNEGEIVQQDQPRKLYNEPNDVFGGWFLGNPGMNFIHVDVKRSNGSAEMLSPLFPGTVRVSGTDHQERLILGIRPEHVAVGSSRSARAVPAEVAGSSVQVGGQYLLMLRAGDLIVKAKTRPETGRKLGKQMHVELPTEHLMVFTEDGKRARAKLKLG
jgi:ABC-type sugar transport system ATPase subunit